MKTFYFKGDMAKRFGDSISVEAKTFRDAMSAFDALLPGFRPFLVRKALSGIQYFFISDEISAVNSMLSSNIPNSLSRGTSFRSAGLVSDFSNSLTMRL